MANIFEFLSKDGNITPEKARKSQQMQFHDKTVYVWGLLYRWDPSLSMNPVRRFAHFMPPCLVPPPWVRSPDPTILSWSLLALGRLLPSDDDDGVDVDDGVGLATSQASRISGLCLLWICMDHVARPSFGAFKIMMIMKILMTMIMTYMMMVKKMISTLKIILTHTQLG